MTWVVWHAARMKKPRKAKKSPPKKHKPRLDANQIAFKMVQTTIRESAK